MSKSKLWRDAPLPHATHGIPGGEGRVTLLRAHLARGQAAYLTNEKLFGCRARSN